MKIAFDLDGTIWSYQRMFAQLHGVLSLSGHEVGILTEHLGAQEADRTLLCRRGFRPFDFYIGKTKENVMEGEDSASWKLRMMTQYDIDLLFDDCDNENDGAYQEMLDSGRVIFIKPRLPINRHFK